MKYYTAGKEEGEAELDNFGTLSVRLKFKISGYEEHGELEFHFSDLQSVPKMVLYLKKYGILPSREKSRYVLTIGNKMYKTFYYGKLSRQTLKAMSYYDDVKELQGGIKDIEKQFTFEGLPTFIKFRK